MSSHLLPIFSPLPICFERGDGLWLTDTEGKRYLDGFAGIAVNGVGHNHPRLVAALKDQVEHLIHCSNYFRIDLQEDVAAKICEKSGMRGCFFCNSGLEANEAAIKLARKYAHLKGITQPRIIVFDHAFHGRSIATLSATANAVVRRDFGPYTPDFVRVPAGDIKTIEKLAETLPGICAVMFEPVQGEGGICVIPDETMRAIRELCDKHDWLMILDEVQTGMGRTGTMWRCEAEDVVPDVMTFGKAFGGGVMPITGFICRPHMWSQPLIDNPYLLGSTTFGGNPVCCSAAIATIRYMLAHDIPGQCRDKGALLKKGLEDMAAKYPTVVKEVRGVGMMLAVEFYSDEIGYEFSKEMYNHKVIIAGTLNNAETIRFEPPGVLTEEEIATVIQAAHESAAKAKEVMKL